MPLAPSPLSRVTIRSDPQTGQEAPRHLQFFTPRVQIVTQPVDSTLKTPPASIPTSGKQMQQDTKKHF